jgi:hypothetical protein
VEFWRIPGNRGPAAIGRPLTAMISIMVEWRHHEALLNRLRAEPAVASCYRTTGEYPFIAQVHVSSTEELEALIDDLSDVGARCSTSIVLSTPVEGAPLVPTRGLGQSAHETHPPETAACRCSGRRCPPGSFPAQARSPPYNAGTRIRIIPLARSADIKPAREREFPGRLSSCTSAINHLDR